VYAENREQPNGTAIKFSLKGNDSVSFENKQGGWAEGNIYDAWGK
jgi:hypothetical protein